MRRESAIGGEHMDERRGIWRLPEGQRSFYAEALEEGAQYDCIVVGGGTAGALAAIALAQRGARVLIVERMNCLGGTGTAGHVPAYYFGSHGGLYEQIDAATRPYEAYGYATESGFNVELKKRVLENTFLSFGGQAAFDADLTGVLMEGRRVLGVEYADRRGLHQAQARLVIDATAEGYVCLLAGAQYTLGRELDHRTQPYSCVHIVSRENRTATHTYIDCGYADATDPEDYSRAILSAVEYPFYLKEDFSQGERLLGRSQQVGMREGPLIVGDERIRLEAVADGAHRPEKVLFYAYANADNHGKDMAFENRPQQDWMVACSLWGLNLTVAVPVGAVIPKGVDNLLMAGRMISVEHDLASCVRMERDVQKCGEAVGILAAEALAARVSPREVDYPRLARELRKSGCLLEQNNFGFVNRRYPLQQGRVLFPETLDELRELLASSEPGMAIWRGRKHAPRQDFYPWLEDENPHLRIHTAMMLALGGDPTGAPLLMEAVRQRDCFVPSTSLKYNMIRGVSCLYLLGRLAYAGALEEVLGLVAHWQEIVPERFVSDEFLYDEEEYRFQYLSMAIWAARQIAQAHPETQASVDRVIHGVIDRDDFSIHSTLKGAVQLKFEMAGILRSALGGQAEPVPEATAQ